MRRSAAPSVARASGPMPPSLASLAAASNASTRPHDAENVPPEAVAGAGGATEAAPAPPAAPVAAPKRSFVAPAAAPSKRRAFDAPGVVGGGVGGGVSVVKALGARAPPTVAPPQPSTSAPTTSTSYYAVLYAKRSNKKRISKSFMDGFLEVKGDSGVTLFDAENKQIARSRLKGMADAPEGATGELGGWEFEVGERVSPGAWNSGSVFMAAVGSAPVAAAVRGGGGVPPPRLGFKAVGLGGAAAPPPPPPRPLHDPSAPGAIVINADAVASGRDAVAVVLDPFLTRRLRPHQVDAVRFMWDRVTSLPSVGRAGGVLADQMGLGKTLSTIALIFCALKQGPSGRPIARRAVVACPASLVGNWASEIKKWCGDERLKCVAIQPGGDVDAGVAKWKVTAQFPILIASYEAVRKLAPSLEGCVDILVCDEAHRLKSAAGSATQTALGSLRAPRVLLLTGTPLQNNLGELWATLDFVAPGVLGPLATFQRVFAAPIAASRDAAATPDERALGATRAAELAARISSIVLRRTSAVLAAPLPPLHVVDVFCGLPPQQEAAYKAALAASDVARLLGGASTSATSGVLPLISRLRALCVAPCLAERTAGDDGGPASRPPLPPAADLIASSGKLTVLHALLVSIAAGGERVIVTSTSTAVLDAVATIATTSRLTTTRIDGKTPAATRQDVVDAFNRPGGAAIMLLSARAGGAGLNLVGAARLIMCDLDWNPAVNAQTAARVWRDGQRAPRCVVYRLHATGTLDEKLFQRVLFKQGLAAALQRGGGGGGGDTSRRGGRDAAGAFTRDELRSLFSLATTTACGTRDLVLKGGKDGVDDSDGTWAASAAPGWDGPLDAAAASGRVTWARVANGRAEVVVEDADEATGYDPAAAAGVEDDGSPADDETALEVE